MEYQNNIQGESFVIVDDHYDVKEYMITMSVHILNRMLKN